MGSKETLRAREREKGSEGSYPGQDTSNAGTDSQALGPPKNGPINSQVQIEEEFKGPYPSLLDYLLLVDSGRGGTMTFSCVHTGDDTRIQWIVPSNGVADGSG